jgi:hypothetical protein
MCNVTNPQLKYILENINTFSVNEINAFVQNKGLELSCLIKYEISAELLNNLNINILKQQVEIEGITQTQLQSAGMNKALIDELFENEIVEIDEDDENIFSGEEIKDNDDFGLLGGDGFNKLLIDRVNAGQIGVNELQDHLNNNAISAQTLRDYCGLDDRMIKRIEDYSPEQMPPVSLQELPALKPNCTDFYFLGMPSAGKSCLIASLLTHWMRTGICNPEVSNPRGVKYFRLLAGGFAKGILPRNNPNTFIDYIEVTLNLTETQTTIFGPKTKKSSIPINILDMAGEKFEKVADEGAQYFTQHKTFLDNTNRKALFFILDYTLDNEGEDAFGQSLSLSVVLNNLKEMGIINKTDSIFLVVTKADMFPVSKEKYQEYANQYIDDYYGSFKQNLENLRKEANIEFEIIPYSIGKCVFGQLLEDYNPKTNENLRNYPAILGKKIESLTARYNKSWFTL